jgi:hypothetical protein
MNDGHVFTKRFFGLGILSTFCICLTLWVNIAPLSAQDVPPAAKAAAEKGFRSLLEAIPPDALSHFNFSNTDEVRQALLGEGFRVHTIPPELILSYDGNVPIEEMIRPTSMWFFPVISRGQIRTLVTVDMVGKEFKAVSIGGSGLSRQWALVQEIWPSSGKSERFFVRVYQAAADFVVISDAVETKVALLKAQGEKTLAGGRELTLHDPADVIMGLQGRVRENIDAARLMEGVQ